METKLCKRCGREMPVSLFAANRTKPDGLQNWCKPCNNEYMAIRNAAKRAEIEELKKAVTAAVKEAPANAESVTTKDGRTFRRVSADCKPLKDFTSRELLEEIKARGYVWDNMWVKTRVEYNKI